MSNKELDRLILGDLLKKKRLSFTKQERALMRRIVRQYKHTLRAVEQAIKDGTLEDN